MSEISDEELKRLFKNLEALDELPLDVSVRMDATIDKLAAQEKSRKRSRLSSTSWALAASFTLVFGLGVVLNFESSPTSQSPSTNTSESIERDDDVLTSTGNQPIRLEKPVPQYSSGVDYSKDVSLGDISFMPEVNYGTLTKLDSSTRSCLVSLGFEETVSVIDKGSYQDQKATAVWSALSEQSWLVYILNDDCQGLREILVNG